MSEFSTNLSIGNMTAQELIAAHQSEHGKMPNPPYLQPTGEEKILKPTGVVQPLETEELPSWLGEG